MSILKPTPGQMCDRLSILELKISAYQRDRRDSDSLIREKSEIIRKLDFHGVDKPEALDSLFRELTLINMGLWEYEDEIRYSEDVSRTAHIGKEISSLNDKRTSLMREIDVAFKCSAPVEEKIYSCTTPK